MTVLAFTIPFVDTPQFYTGTASTTLVPHVFPVAINGRPYMVDQKAGTFARSFDPRVRDSVDQSTAPGEAAINPGGLWRRGQVSWHLGAGQKYADVADSQDYRFYASKGVNPWVRGQLSLLNATKVSLASAATVSHMVVQDGYVIASLNGDLKYSSDPYNPLTASITNVSAAGGTVTYTTSADHPFRVGAIVTITGVNPTAYNLTNVSIASVPTSKTFTVTNAATGAFVSGGTASSTWADVTGEPAGTCASLATDGSTVYACYPSSGVRAIIQNAFPAAWSLDTNPYQNTGTTSFYMVGFAKNYLFGSHDHKLKLLPGSGSTSDVITPTDSGFRWVGVATGQNAVYAAGYAGKKSLIYKVTIKDDATLNTGSVALELPTGEVVTAISGYLGFILLGTNKGVRFCSTDSGANLIAGQLIPTSGDVNKFSSNDRFSYFTWTNYDGTSGGLGRLDLSQFIAPNTPAYATDLMYDSTATVLNVVTFSDKHCFVVSGVGVIAEDSANLVTSGIISSGNYRWGIPDRKFVAKIDTRSLPLVGSIKTEYSLDGGAWTTSGTWDSQADTENTFSGSDTNAIEAQFRFTLYRQTATTGPTFTRWAARAYAAPYRAELFQIPVLIHNRIKVHDKDYYFDPDEELKELRQLIKSPKVVTLQVQDETLPVIVEDVEWRPLDSVDLDWLWQGTATVTMRSVQE